MKNTIQESQDNDLILTQVLAEEVKKARYNHSAEKVLDELGIEVIK